MAARVTRPGPLTIRNGPTTGSESLEKDMNPLMSTNPKDKFGKAKPDLTLIPPAAEIHEALAMGNGAGKYGPFNWRAGTVSARTYLAAAKRHIAAWLDGEENAADSGVHHLGHARASLGIILDAQEHGTMLDDRPVPGSASRLLEQYTRQVVLTPTVEEIAKAVQQANNGETIELSEGDLNASLMAELDKVRLRRVYIAGPMRGYEKFNFPAFDKARDMAFSLGWDPISPADLDRESGFHEDSPPISATTPDITREFVRRDADALISLRSERGDAIAMLPGWTRSTGALAEFFMARWLGLRVLDATTMEPFVNGAINIKDMYAAITEAADKYITSHSQGTKHV